MRPRRASMSSVRLTAVIRPNQPTTKRSSPIPIRLRTDLPSSSQRTRGSSSIPSRTTVNFSAGATPSRTSSSRTCGLTATRTSVARASAVSISRKTREPTAPKYPRRTWPWKVWTTIGRGGPESNAAVRPTAPAFAVCVCTICGRTRRISRASRIAARRSRTGRNLAGEPRDRHDLDPRPLGDERHRFLPRCDLAGDERRVVAAGGEAPAQVRDVQRRAADVQAGDHAEHTDALGPAVARRVVASGASVAGGAPRGRCGNRARPGQRPPKRADFDAAARPPSGGRLQGFSRLGFAPQRIPGCGLIQFAPCPS